VVAKSANYLGYLWTIMRNSSAAVPKLLEDYPNCGVRNNNTFAFNPFDPAYNGTFFGIDATADYSVECLWDCTWQENPYVGKTYFIDFPKNNYTLTFRLYLPKVPRDLRCLNNCTDTQASRLVNIVIDDTCFSSTVGSFLGCYIYNYYRINGAVQDYFYLAAESCILAILEPGFYPEGNCKEQKINLRVYYPYGNLTSYLYNSYLPNNSKLSGPATDAVTEFAGGIIKQVPKINKHPWLCSLRTPGYRGVHKCGVTLLSGPPRPTIFVSAAHCNYLCKNDLGQVVELCCCRKLQSEFSCKNSSFCGDNPMLQDANPSDLQIVCNIGSQKVVPQGIGYPTATILNILEIRNHPNYKPLSDGIEAGGPILGSDICVYIVDDNKLASNMNTSTIWPACMPKADEEYIIGNQGILAGWNEPRPTYLTSFSTIEGYDTENFVVREDLLEKQPSCADPKWMNSTTYYPPGTLCFTDIAWAGSVQFGVSGSGLVRPFTSSDKDEVRYSWVGPLSLSKGSDRPQLDFNYFYNNDQQASYNTVVNYNSNPAVFTDARCYLDWIAAQYGLSLPATYSKPASCYESTGNKFAVNNTNCLARPLNLAQFAVPNLPEKCQFTPGQFDRCKLYAFDRTAKPAFNLNFYYCQTAKGYDAACANDCPGVDPNAVVVGGAAALFAIAAATSGTNIVGPLLGAGVGVAGLGVGGMAMMRQRAACPAGQCRARAIGRCCPLVVINGRQVCPNFC
jgi:hypothetical protein